MYLHIGADCAIPIKFIVGIFDLDTCTNSYRSPSRLFLKKAEEKGLVYYLNEEIPSSFVLLIDGRIYLSHLSSHRLRLRLKRLHSQVLED